MDIFTKNKFFALNKKISRPRNRHFVCWKGERFLALPPFFAKISRFLPYYPLSWIIPMITGDSGACYYYSQAHLRGAF